MVRWEHFPAREWPLLLLAGLLLLAAAWPAHAQVPQGSPLRWQVAPPAPRVGPAPAPAPLPPAAPQPGADTRGPVSAVSVQGATVYPLPDLQAMTAGLVGPATSAASIETVRRAILSKYRGDGYAFVVVNSLWEPSGLLRFSVIEGYIAEVKLDGDVGPAGTQVLRFLSHLTEPRAIDTATLERWLLLAQDVPGITVQPLLQRSAQPGALVLVAKLSHKTVSGMLSADNAAFRKTGPAEALAAVDIDSLTSLGERTEVSLFHSLLDNTQIFGQVSSDFFVGGSGLAVRLYAGAGNTLPCCDLHLIGYTGQTVVYGAQVSYPVVKSRNQVLTALALLDAIDSQVALGTPEQRASGDSLRILRLGGDYALHDAVLGDAWPATDRASARISQGLPVLGASHDGRADASRLNEQVAFSKVSGEVSREQALPSPSESFSLSLFGLLTGQYARDILPASEKFYLGGLRFTRGFYSGEVSGDSALAATAELRLNTSIAGEPFGVPFDIATQFFTFYDWGETWENEQLDANHALRSFGGGVRLTVTAGTEVDLEGLRRVTRQLQGASGKPDSATAFYWRVVTRF